MVTGYMSEDLFSHNDLGSEEEANLYFGITDAKVHVLKTDYHNFYYTARWGNRQIISDHSSGPWAFLNPDKSTEDLTPKHWEEAYPGLSHVKIYDWHLLLGTFQDKPVHWSPTQNAFTYTNNRKVNFPPPTPEEEEVSQLLDSSIQTIERATARLTPDAPTTSLPGAFNPPETPPAPSAPSVAKGKQPATKSHTTQQPTPPVSKATPTAPPPASVMSTATASNRILGSAPEPFDGAADKAEAFWTVLENYYFLNKDIYSTPDKKIASSLTHFKLGTSAGEWAKDRQKAALAANPQTFGTWQSFKDDFKAHFIPVDTELSSTQQMYSLKMGNRPFNQWYQDWSTHASRSGANEGTKMFAFRQNIPQPLHNKIMAVSPPPTTMTRLVELAREFDQIWRQWQVHTTKEASASRGRRSNIRSANPEDPENPDIALANFPPGNKPREPRFKKLSTAEKEKRRAEGRCMYCGKNGHWQDKCPEKPQRKNNFRQNRQNPPRTRALQSETAPVDSPPPEQETPTVSRLYHDPENKYDVLTSDHPDLDF